LSADRATAVRGAPPATASAPPPRALLLALVAGLAASITLSQASLVALAVWLLWRSRAGDAVPGGWPLAAPILGFAGWTIVSAALSGAPADSLLTTKSLLSLAAFWIVLRALPDAERARWFSTALFVAVTVAAVFAIVQVGTCSETRLDRVDPAWPAMLRSWFGKCRRGHGFFSIYMTLAGVLSLALMLMLPRLRTLSSNRVLAGAAWIVGALALGLTYVRGAWIGFATGVLTLAITLPRQVAVLAGVVVVAAGALLAPGILERVGTMGSFADDTSRDRLAMLSTGLRLVREHPVLGVGPGQVKRLYPEYAPPEALRRRTSHVHNTPLQIAVERGVVGLALWVAIFVEFFSASVRVLRRLPAEAVADRAVVAGSIAGIAAFLVAGVFEYNFGDMEVLLVALSIMALPFVIDRDRARCAA
jgi:O-antigen ligase